MQGRGSNTATYEKFLGKIIKTGDCWIWQAALNPHGYGFFGYNGRQTLVHRVSYMFHKGEIPYGLVIMHTCDTPSCVNPAHLIAGTQKENIQDCIAKGRHAMQSIWANNFCVNGHELNEHSIKFYKGKRYCGSCSTARPKRTAERRKQTIATTMPCS